MTPATKLFHVLADEARRLGRKLNSEEWIAAADAWMASEFKLLSRSSIPISKMTDKEFVAWLSSQPCYAGIDVVKEIGKCQVWAAGRGLKASRRRIINWLNRGEQNLTVSCQGASSRKQDRIDIYQEPENWRATAQRLFPNTDIKDRNWRDICVCFGAQIIQAMEDGR